VFVPFADGRPTGMYEEFATGFAGQEPPADPAQAPHRPMGLAVGPDGALYVSDDVNGRVWRITYPGN
jgi:glucose/arabinose dehydrogenase